LAPGEQVVERVDGMTGPRTPALGPIIVFPVLVTTVIGWSFSTFTWTFVLMGFFGGLVSKLPGGGAFRSVLRTDRRVLVVQPPRRRTRASILAELPVHTSLEPRFVDARKGGLLRRSLVWFAFYPYLHPLDGIVDRPFWAARRQQF
jgi:hypothetical protein